MTEFEFSKDLANILEERAKVKLGENGSAILKEEFLDGEEMKLDLRGVPEGSVILKPDELGGLKKGLRHGEWFKSCDYIVVCSLQGHCHPSDLARPNRFRRTHFRPALTPQTDSPQVS
ncbi:MAG: hypothetical protein OXF72_05760 [Gammaproteobacteria bacterium]|nr:hypothetical protein [Gammaproteobacteria bacterium]MCY4198580.1 hypothetical protein [Gammaproteobacteria bacterium]MCY4277264.1 hypothetical protein [Gammaproteobacteria bacterium]MCY4322982.1 hypothetical protein [Gammaproteobacteria bacterium]